MVHVWSAEVSEVSDTMIECRVTGPSLVGLRRSAGSRAGAYARANGLRITERLFTNESGGEGFTACVWARYKVARAS